MRARTSSGLRVGLLTSFFLLTVFHSVLLSASNLEDTAHQFAQKIAAAAGAGSFALDVTNRSSLDDKSVRDVRSAIETRLQAAHLLVSTPEKSSGTIHVILGESLREYVWVAEVLISANGDDP